MMGTSTIWTTPRTAHLIPEIPQIPLVPLVPLIPLIPMKTLRSKPYGWRGYRMCIPVGETGGGMAPSGEQVGNDGETGSAGSAPNPSTGQGSLSPVAETSTQASPDESTQDQVSAPVEEEHDDDDASGGVELSLKDIFEEGVKVDEHLKDLADSQDDIRVEDLAGELREFLSELER